MNHYLLVEESLKAQMRIYQPLPDKARKSTTLDDGSEHIYHVQLKKQLGMKPARP